MEKQDHNNLLFMTLSNVHTIETSRVSMFPINDKYGHPPFLRFRFKKLSKDDIIYEKLIKLVSTFKGNLKWKMFTKNSINNYIIIPEVFNIEIDGSFYDNQSFISKFSENEYKKLVDLAIEDIPSLAELIGIIQ